MNLPEEVKTILTADFMKAMSEIQMCRTAYVLEKFVVGQYCAEEQRYAQCVLEMQVKYDNIRRAILRREKTNLEQAAIVSEVESLRAEQKMNLARQKEIEGELKEIDIEEQDRAMLGAVREFAALHAIFKAFKKNYTREDIDKAQPAYWAKRLTHQAELDMLSYGRVQVGNADALHQIGINPAQALDSSEAVAQRYLEVGNLRVLTVVPVEKDTEEDVPKCLNGVVIPTTIMQRVLKIVGFKVDAAYNEAVHQALKDEADYLFTVEDDTFPPADAFIRLLELCEKNPKSACGGWYPKRSEIRAGAPIILQDGVRRSLDEDGTIHECYSLPMGCSLFPVAVFRETKYPWFRTTDNLTQDSFFSQLAREAGWKLLCDTSIRCRHIDRVTGKVYE